MQAAGCMFAILVALWGLREESGKEMLGTFTQFVAQSHHQTLERQVAAVIHEAVPAKQIRPAQDYGAIREAGPAPSSESTWQRMAVMSASQSIPFRSVSEIRFHMMRRAAWADWSVRPPLPPPRFVA